METFAKHLSEVSKALAPMESGSSVNLPVKVG